MNCSTLQKPCILIVLFTGNHHLKLIGLVWKIIVGKVNQYCPKKCDWVQFGVARFRNRFLKLCTFFLLSHMIHISSFLFPSLQISMSVRGHQTVKGAAVSTIWAHTTVSARRATHWSEAGDAKVSLFKPLRSDLYQKTGCCLSFC